MKEEIKKIDEIIYEETIEEFKKIKECLINKCRLEYSLNLIKLLDFIKSYGGTVDIEQNRNYDDANSLNTEELKDCLEDLKHYNLSSSILPSIANKLERIPKEYGLGSKKVNNYGLDINILKNQREYEDKIPEQVKKLRLYLKSVIQIVNDNKELYNNQKEILKRNAEVINYTINQIFKNESTVKFLGELNDKIDMISNLINVFERRLRGDYSKSVDITSIYTVKCLNKNTKVGESYSTLNKIVTSKLMSLDEKNDSDDNEKHFYSSELMEISRINDVELMVMYNLMKNIMNFEDEEELRKFRYMYKENVQGIVKLVGEICSILAPDCKKKSFEGKCNTLNAELKSKMRQNDEEYRSEDGTVILYPFFIHSKEEKMIYFIPYGIGTEVSQDSDKNGPISLLDFYCSKSSISGNRNEMNRVEVEEKHNTWVDEFGSLSINANNSEYTINIASDDTNYLKLFVRTMQIGEEDIIYNMYSNEELRTIINKNIQYQNMKFSTEEAIQKENVLIRRKMGELIYKDDLDGINNVKRGNGLSNISLNINKDKYIGVNNVGVAKELRSKVNIINTSFFMGTNTNRDKCYCIKTEEIKLKPGIINQNSRMLLMSILEKYLKKDVFNSPLTNDYIFEIHKEEILEEYFSKIQLYYNNIIESSVKEFVEDISAQIISYQAVKSILSDKTGKRLKGSKVELKFKASVIEELLNLVILVYKNKKILEPKADFITINSLALNKTNLDYSIITIQDIWGYSFIGSTSKDNTLFTMDKKGFIKLTIGEEEVKNETSLCLKLLYGVLELQNSLDKDMTRSVEKSIAKSEENKNNKKEGEITLNSYLFNEGVGSVSETGEPNNWLNKIRWKENGVVGEDGEVDERWISSYINYLQQIICSVTYVGDKAIPEKIDINFITYLYVTMLFETKHSDIHTKNQLFFNRNQVVDVENKNTPNYVNAIDLWVNYNDINLVDIMLYAEGIKPILDPEKVKEANKFLKVIPTSFKYENLDLKDSYEYLGRTTTKIFLTKSITNIAINAFLEKIRLMTEDDFLSFNEQSYDEMIKDCGLPGYLAIAESDDIAKYISEPHKDIPNNLGIEEYSAYDKKDVNVTALRDILTISNIMSSSILKKAVKNNDVAKIEEEFKKKFLKRISSSNSGGTKISEVYEAILGITLQIGMNESSAENLSRQFYQKVNVIVTHPLEVYYLETELITKLRKYVSAVKSPFDNVIFNENIGSQVIKELEKKAITALKIKGIYNALIPYIPMEYILKLDEEYSVIHNELKKVYSSSSLKNSNLANEINKANILFKTYLSTGNSNYFSSEILNIVSFDVITNQDLLGGNAIPSPYSMKGIILKFDLIDGLSSLQDEFNASPLVKYGLLYMMDYTIKFNSDVANYAKYINENKITDTSLPDFMSDKLLKDFPEETTTFMTSILDFMSKMEDKYQATYKAYKDILNKNTYFDFLQIIENKALDKNDVENSLCREFLIDLPKSIMDYVASTELEIPKELIENYQKNSILKPIMKERFK